MARIFHVEVDTGALGPLGLAHLHLVAVGPREIEHGNIRKAQEEPYRANQKERKRIIKNRTLRELAHSSNMKEPSIKNQ